MGTHGVSQPFPERLLWVRKSRATFYSFFSFEASRVERIFPFRAEVSSDTWSESLGLGCICPNLSRGFPASEAVDGLLTGVLGWGPPTPDEAVGIGGHTVPRARPGWFLAMWALWDSDGPLQVRPMPP